MRWLLHVNLLVLGIVFLSAGGFGAEKSSLKIIKVQGSITDLSQARQPEPWTMKSRITDRLALSLSPFAQTKIQLNSGVVMTVYGPADFEIPLISWETRQFKDIKLKRGSIRFEVHENPFSFELLTPFFQVSPPVGEWVFSIDSERGLADVLALKGNLEVTSLNSEDRVNLKSGQKATFKGLLEEGEIAYDLLLEGRKIPKGKWQPQEKLSAQDIKAFSVESERQQLAQEQKTKAQARREMLKKEAHSICQKPAGQLRECIWRKEKEGCTRSRCAADGKWKDAQIVPTSFCERSTGWTPESKACDY